MRVRVDYGSCETNGVCMGIAPEMFEVRDDDFVYVLQEYPSESLRPMIEQAVAQCPRGAISVEEED